jgi:hypothetical protein
MSHRIKNVTLEDGFALNPNRIYNEEYFSTLPHQHKEFNFPSSAGNTDFTIYQPANTFLKEMYVVCTSAPTLSSAGNVGMSVSHGSSAAAVTSGTVVLGIGTNIINNHTTMAVNSLSKIFPDSEFTPSSGASETSVGHSSTRRLLAIRVTTSQDASTVGTFKVITVFANTDTSVHQVNPIYTLTGTGTPNVSYDASNGYGGMLLTTSATNLHQAIVHPNSSSGHNALNSGIFKTGSRLEFQTSVIFPVVPGTLDYSFCAGLKLTETPLIATDDHQAMFIFGNSTALVGGSTLASTTNFLFAYSIGGTDYITDLGLPVVANREYHLKFLMDKNRKIKVFINGIQFGLTSTSGSMGTTATNTYDDSTALTTNISLYPVIGIQTTGAAESVVVNYIKVSRDSKKVSS